MSHAFSHFSPNIQSPYAESSSHANSPKWFDAAFIQHRCNQNLCLERYQVNAMMVMMIGGGYRVHASRLSSPRRPGSGYSRRHFQTELESVPDSHLRLPSKYPGTSRRRRRDAGDRHEHFIPSHSQSWNTAPAQICDQGNETFRGFVSSQSRSASPRIDRSSWIDVTDVWKEEQKISADAESLECNNHHGDMDRTFQNQFWDNQSEYPSEVDLDSASDTHAYLYSQDTEAISTETHCMGETNSAQDEKNSTIKSKASTSPSQDADIFSNAILPDIDVGTTPQAVDGFYTHAAASSVSEDRGFVNRFPNDGSFMDRYQRLQTRDQSMNNCAGRAVKEVVAEHKDILANSVTMGLNSSIDCAIDLNAFDAQKLDACAPDATSPSGRDAQDSESVPLDIPPQQKSYTSQELLRIRDSIAHSWIPPGFDSNALPAPVRRGYIKPHSRDRKKHTDSKQPSVKGGTSKKKKKKKSTAALPEGNDVSLISAETSGIPQPLRPKTTGTAVAETESALERFGALLRVTQDVVLDVQVAEVHRESTERLLASLPSDS
eukprot:m.513141 g.513141  ORF g.513141 m.513141 type:complete len:547 (+) comp21902_c0_seq2:498-2138(+)